MAAGKSSPFDTEIGNSVRKSHAKRLPGCVTITINSKRKIAHATSDLRCWYFRFHELHRTAVGYRRWRTTGLNLAKANANNLAPGTNENITFKARWTFRWLWYIQKRLHCASLLTGDFVVLLYAWFYEANKVCADIRL